MKVTIKKIISELEKKVNHWHEMTDNNDHLDVRLEIADFFINQLMWKKYNCDLFIPSYLLLEDCYKKYMGTKEGTKESSKNRKEFFDCFDNYVMTLFVPEIKQVILKGLR